jgi:hypothetical protein
MAESERREFLYRAVRTVVAELSVLGIRPTPGLVLSRLKDSPLRSLATIGEAIREALAANAGWILPLIDVGAWSSASIQLCVSARMLPCSVAALHDRRQPLSN